MVDQIVPTLVNGRYVSAGVCDGDAVEDCAGECGGSAEVDDCGECNGDGSSCETHSIDITYSSDADIAGFQFNMDGVTVLSASGGDAAANGFTVSTSATTVLGFSFTGSVIPAGSGVLTVLEVEGDVDSACIVDLVLSDADGNGLDAEIVDCLSIVYEAECADADGDEICGDVDDCPADSLNDIDGDLLCANNDDCPFDFDNDLDEDEFGTAPLTVGTANVSTQDAMPGEVQLSQNYPNPFNPSTTISFSIPEDGNVNLSIYDITGRLVYTLLNENIQSGSHEFTWHGVDMYGLNVSGGMYIYTLESKDISNIIKLFK